MSALRDTYTDYETVAMRVWRGEALLWIVIDGVIKAAIVTKIGIANDRKVCTIVACGGYDLLGWLPLIEDLEKYARLEGCKAVVITGRRGWKRVLPQYTQRAVMLERIL